MGIFRDDSGNLLRGEGVRGDKVQHLLAGKNLSLGADGRGGLRKFSVRLEAGMGDPAHVPQLQENAAPGLVHGGDHLFPSRHLLRGVDTGRVGVTVAAGRDGGGLRDDQPGGGPLAVILRVHVRGDVALGRPTAGERRHENAMR